jgi:ribulose-phosphate 3-epimerase
VVLVMSVTPGFGAQAFQPIALEKLQFLRKAAPEGVVLEVDGGVNASTIGSCAAAGADWLVAGSAIFRTEDYARSVRELTSLATQP